MVVIQFLIFLIFYYSKHDAFHVKQQSCSLNKMKFNRRPLQSSTIDTNANTNNAVNDLQQDVFESGKDVKKLNFEPLFTAIAKNKYFVSCFTCLHISCSFL